MSIRIVLLPMTLSDRWGSFQLEWTILRTTSRRMLQAAAIDYAAFRRGVSIRE